jgi:hypothetical protein
MHDLIINVLSWGGCVLLLWGLKLIGDKKLKGFYVATVAEFLWIAWGLMTHSWALVVMSLWIVGMYVRAIWLWRKDAP